MEKQYEGSAKIKNKAIICPRIPLQKFQKIAGVLICNMTYASTEIVWMFKNKNPSGLSCFVTDINHEAQQIEEM